MTKKARSRNNRSFWKVGEYLIEFWRLKGNEGYDKRMEETRVLAKGHRGLLLEITYADLATLDVKLRDLAGIRYG